MQTTYLDQQILKSIEIYGFKLDTLPFQGDDTIFNLVKKMIKTTIKFYITAVKKDRMPKIKNVQELIRKNVDHEINSWNQHPQLSFVMEIVSKELIADCFTMLNSLNQIQDIYTSFLKYEFFSQLQLINTFDDKINLHWFTKIILQEVTVFLKKSMVTQPNMMYDTILDQLNEELTQLVQFMNEQFTVFYKDCQDYLREEVSCFQINSDKSQIMNKYLIIGEFNHKYIGLLHELSARVYQIVDNYLIYSIFVNSSKEVRECFAQFVIFNYENLSIVCLQEDILSTQRRKYNKIHEKIDLLRSESINEENIELKAVQVILNQLIDKSMLIQLHHVRNKQTHKMGIHLQALGNEELIQYVIHKPEKSIIITNAKLVPNLWSYVKESLNCKIQIFDEKQSNQKDYQSIEHVFQEEHFKEQMIHFSQQEKYKNCNHESDSISNATSNASSAEVAPVIEHVSLNPSANVGGSVMMSSAAGDIGSSLGYCLANINRYQSKKDFLKDFGSTAAINGSITYLVVNLPVIGKLVAIGGFGYFAMKIYKNQTASQSSKVEQYEKLILGTGTSIGASIGGAFIGQALIPVPILGALIGGFLGGLVGGTSSAVICEYMNDKKTKEIINELESVQDIENGNWVMGEGLIGHLGLSYEYFIEQCPPSLKFDEERQQKWINMLCYGFICLYYTQRDELDQLQRQEQRKKDNKPQKTSQSPSLTDLDSLQKTVHASNIDIEFDDQDDQVLVDEEDDYHHEWPKSIDLSTKWLRQNDVVVQHGLVSMESTLKNVISNL